MRINPDTLKLEGLPTRPLARREINQLDLPPCPICGATIHIDWAEVTAWEDHPRRTYIPGLWECPKGCAP